MNRCKWLIMILALFLVGSTTLVGQTSAAGKSIFTAFTGDDRFDPFNLLGDGAVGDILFPGTVACPGHEPTGNPAQPCPTGSRTHTRGFTIQTRLIASDSRFTGLATVVLNANFDADGNGPAWGTISIAIANNLGTWEGTWAGIRVFDVDHSVWVIPVHSSGRGTEGSVDGMLYRAVDRIETPFPVPIAYVGKLEGRIIDPNSK